MLAGASIGFLFNNFVVYQMFNLINFTIGSALGFISGAIANSLFTLPIRTLIGAVQGALAGAPVGALAGAPIGGLVGALVGAVIGAVIGTPIGAVIGAPVLGIPGTVAGAIGGTAIGLPIGAALLGSLGAAAGFVLSQLLGGSSDTADPTSEPAESVPETQEAE